MNVKDTGSAPRQARLHPGERRLARLSIALLAVVLCVTFASRAKAQAPAAAVPSSPASAPLDAPRYAPPDGSWASELESLLKWMDDRKSGSTCAEHCFTLDRLQLRGAVGAGLLDFELEGAVLAPGAVAVPLFGPPDRVRLEDTTENGKPATIGFDSKGYFLHTASRRFVLRGKLSLQGDSALVILGPLNSLQADLSQGRVVEGSRLSGLANATIHLDATSGAGPASEPTVFQLSRAIRIGREIAFEYRLVLRSGVDLGVASLPLRFGERVLDVQGANGWRVDDSALVLPTSGRSAQITITGTLPTISSFSPDDRSAYEWWLLESDPEHRLEVEGTARQIERSESPIPSTMPTARLYMVQRGQQISVRVQSLVSSEVLAAIVHGYSRMAVLTRTGDAVFDDRLQYENNGIDYLLFSPQGRPIYLDVDGGAQRIMHKQGAEGDVMVPLQTGSHTARVQSLAATGLSRFGGALRVPMGSHSLTSSSVTLTIGLPDHIVPLAALGGDNAVLLLGLGDAIAMLFALGAAWIVTSTRWRRVGAAIAFAGLWFVSPVLFVVALLVLAFIVVVRVVSRLLRGAQRTAALGVIVAVGIVVGVIALSIVATTARFAGSPSSTAPSSTARPYEARDSVTAPATGNWAAQTAQGGVLEGVAPVALPLPSYDRSISVSREFVTRERPFHPVVYYVTTWVLYPLVVAWLAVIFWLIAAHRAELAQVRDRIKARLDRPAPATARAPEPAPPSDESPHEA